MSGNHGAGERAEGVVEGEARVAGVGSDVGIAPEAGRVPMQVYQEDVDDDEEEEEEVETVEDSAPEDEGDPPPGNARSSNPTFLFEPRFHILKIFRFVGDLSEISAFANQFYWLCDHFPQTARK